MNLKEKWNEANKKYPWLKPVLIGSAIALVCGGGYYLYKKNQPEPIVELPSAPTPMPEPIPYESEQAPDPTVIENAEAMFKEFWEQNYKDNWDEVVECAKRLELKPGEMFIIEDPSAYGNDTEPIISHLVNGSGLYPPDYD